MIALTGGTATAALAGCLGGDEDDTGAADGHGDEEHAGTEAEYEAYLVTYHWGFAAFDEHGDELDLIEVAPNTEVTLHTVNDHAYDAFEELPDLVAAELEEFDALERTKQHVEDGRIAKPDDATIEEMYNDAHGRDGDDDGHDDDGHDDDGHDDDGHDDDGHDDDGHDDDGHDDDGHDDDGHDDDGHDDDGHDDDGHDHDDALLDHGFMIPALDVTAEVPADAENPTTVSFRVDEPGTYQARCTIACGYGHTYQQHELIHVTDDT